jgi:hypothetical protein
MKSGLHGEPVGVPIRMSAKPVERRFSWGHITSFGGGLQLIVYVGKFLKLAPFGSVPAVKHFHSRPTGRLSLEWKSGLVLNRNPCHSVVVL